MTDKNSTETLTQYARIYSDPPEKIREAGRGIVVKDGKILLTYEINTDVYMTPGGGPEEGESLAECCVREIKEEAGYIVKPEKPFLKINEYCFETLYVSNYFICTVTGECERSLTDIEIEHGAVPRWVDLDEAIAIFSEYEKFREDVASLYLREYTILSKYLAFIK